MKGSSNKTLGHVGAHFSPLSSPSSLGAITPPFQAESGGRRGNKQRSFKLFDELSLRNAEQLSNHREEDHRWAPVGYEACSKGSYSRSPEQLLKQKHVRARRIVKGGRVGSKGEFQEEEDNKMTVTEVWDQTIYRFTGSWHLCCPAAVTYPQPTSSSSCHRVTTVPQGKRDASSIPQHAGTSNAS
ncbi:hypothetical protein EYF80_013520 [Liparis tanakae]|uniref:Uncharacterized protein n=1 Tax=Liparis tanakae TaxID=230148 RepID=A0A4Z2IG04_9TELE|nr:hypothetical protein EYF80_013520 [Liparis tanakae]